MDGLTDLNVGAGNAWASQSKLISAPPATSKESDFADLGNFGDTRPAGSDIHKVQNVILGSLAERATAISVSPASSGNRYRGNMER